VAALIYVINMSLDGYIEDADGHFDWSHPSEELHAFVNDVARGADTYLYGRRMYETMAVWETDADLIAHGDITGEFAQIWQAADKVVYSRTLSTPATARTTIERDFDADAVRAMKAPAPRDLMIGGAEIAAEAFRAGLVDECHLLVHQVAVGGGKPALPLGVRVDLELLDQARFADGTMHLHYAVRH
jgi:dihydrofolate reductase